MTQRTYGNLDETLDDILEWDHWNVQDDKKVLSVVLALAARVRELEKPEPTIDQVREAVAVWVTTPGQDRFISGEVGWLVQDNTTGWWASGVETGDAAFRRMYAALVVRYPEIRT